MIGPPGSGKSMLAARLPTILPPLTPAELLEVSMIASVAGVIENGALTNRRPFRAPHHSAIDAGAGRRRLARAAGRGLARASRRAVPRRAAGIPAAGARRAAPAARDRRGRDRARQPPRHLSGALHAGGGDESVPLRPRVRSGLYLPARAERALRRRIPGAAVGPAARPHRSHIEVPAVDRRRPDPAAAGRRQPRGRAPASRAPAPCSSSAMPRSALPASRTNAAAPADRAGGGRAARQHAGSRCCATPPTPCGFRRAAITGCCGWRARSPTSTARKKSAACIWPRRCPIAR